MTPARAVSAATIARFGGDIIWEIGSGYFGCRNGDGTFCAERFVGTRRITQVKMIEIKLSQGAKPGHGGVLPGPKVTRGDFRRARRADRHGLRVAGEPFGVLDAAGTGGISSPSSRELSGGKPIGFKLCIGHPWEFMGICKAMLRDRHPPGLHRRRRQAKAAPARHRWSSSTISARRCAKAAVRAQHAWSGAACATRSSSAWPAASSLLRHGARLGARRRLVQRGARLHVRAGLRAGAVVPH